MDTWEEYQGVNSQSWKEFDWKIKIKIRYFFCLPVLVKDHFWGDCLVIKGFLENFKREIKGSILQVYVPLQPVLFLLGRAI